MVNESRYRLAVIVCLLLLAGFLVNSISSYYVSRENVRKTITESSLPLTSDNIYSVIQRDLLKPIFISSMMANDAFLRAWTISGEQETSQIQRYLHEIRREYGTVTSFFVSENSRNYYYADGILKQVEEEEPRDEWFFRVREMEEPFEINVDPDLANQDALTIFINYRVLDFEGNFIGAAGTGLTVNRVNLLIEDYEEKFGRDIFFCNREGKIVLSPTRSSLQGYEAIGDIPGLAPFADEILEASGEGVTYQKKGGTYFLNSRLVPELDWILMVEQTEDALLGPMREALWLNIGLAVLLTAIVAFVCISAIQRHQKKLEARNHDLSLMNQEVEKQKDQLEQTAKELEAANVSLSELNREKDDFLSIVAHDLRNPLNGILGLSEETESKLPADLEELRSFQGDIRNCGREMLELIEDILNVSAIENFRGKPELQPHHWNQLVRDAEDRFRGQARRKGIALAVDLDEAAEIDVVTNGKWMAICLNNLVSNAIKYSNSGTQITMETQSRAGQLEIRVRDQGPGMSAADRERAFEKFVRLSAEATGGESSTGLGLYIVKKMCQRLGARVSVESQPGVGTCFVIQHPLDIEARV